MTGSRIFVVTGSSRGLGAALVDRLLEAGETVIGVQRQPSTSPGRPGLETMVCDLTDLSDVERLVAPLGERLASAQSVEFVNNAGVIGPIRQVGHLDDRAAVVDHATVNYVAPMVLMDGLLRALPDAVRLEVLNISSGAADRPIPGWALYCSSKKAIKSFMDVLATENERVTVTHVDPGVMDTDMQASIRSADARDFPGVVQFRDFQTDGRLRTVAEVAREILADRVA